MMHASTRTSALRRRRRFMLGPLVLAWGVQAIVTQSLLLREALVLMFGSEFAWGLVLFAWLFGVAVGAAFGGWLARFASRGRWADVALVIALVALAAAVPAELWVFRGARAWLGVEPGEMLPLGKTAAAALLFISPVSALVGVAFPLACSIVGERESEEQRAALADHSSLITHHASPVTHHSSLITHDSSLVNTGPLGGIYALESLGSLIGGAAFSFWAVEYLSPIQTALSCGAITFAASGLLFAGSRSRRRAVFLLGGLAGAVVATSTYAGAALNRQLVYRRWHNVAPGYELCAEAESKYQNLAVGRRAGQYTLYCDGRVTADFPDPYTFVPLAHFWMCEHPSPRRVLVLGGAAEGLLAEILRHPIEHVDYVEPDPRQIELIEPFLADADRHALADPRVGVHPVDARYFVKTQRNRFDLVIARLPEPTSALRARFYTDEFYGELRRAMTSRSVLCTTAAATPTTLTTASAEYLASIRATLRRHFPDVIVGWGDPAQILAATADGIVSTDPAELARRYAERRVRSGLFDPIWFQGATDWLDPAKLRQRAAELDAARVEIGTDLRPIIYVQRLVLWERMTGGRSAGMIEWLRLVSVTRLAAALVALAGFTLLVCRVRSRSRHGWATGAVVVSVGTTGFATMALSIIWLFAFQNLYGYVYQRIGWIIALFMGGLVVGCGVANWRSKRVSAECGKYLWRRLISVDLLIAVLTLAAPFVLRALGAMQDTRLAFLFVEWVVSILVAATGVLCGAAFAVAGALQMASGRVHSGRAHVGRPAGIDPAAHDRPGSQAGDSRASQAGTAAGSVVGADHAGACLGALLTGVLLVPVFGTAVSAFLLAAIKLASAALLFLSKRAFPLSSREWPDAR
jgi:spermidine synthase